MKIPSNGHKADHSFRSMAGERTPDGLWETHNRLSILFTICAKITLISENTFLSHFPKTHENQTEQFHYHYVTKRKTRSLTALKYKWVSVKRKRG